FAAPQVATLTPVIDALEHQLIDGFSARDHTDLVAEFTLLFPVQVIAHILGIPRGDHPRFQRWSFDLIAFSKDPATGRAAAATLRDYFLPIVAERRAAPRADVLRRLAGAMAADVGRTD